MIQLADPTQEQLDLAQVMNLCQAGKLASEIAEALNLPLGRVRNLLRDEPRRYQRGPGAGAGPAYQSKRGTL